MKPAFIYGKMGLKGDFTALRLSKLLSEVYVMGTEG